MNKSVILIGGFNEIIELCLENYISIAGIVDKTSVEKRFPYLGTDEQVESWKKTNAEIPVLITPDLPEVRKKLSSFYKSFGLQFMTLISNNVSISNSAVIEEGTIIQKMVNISSEVRIGKFVKINTMGNVMHNSTIGDFTTIASNAVILGFVNIGKACYIGANATILPNLTVTDNVTIGAGAVVTKDIHENGSVYAGVPARRIK